RGRYSGFTQNISMEFARFGPARLRRTSFESELFRQARGVAKFHLVLQKGACCFHARQLAGRLVLLRRCGLRSGVCKIVRRIRSAALRTRVSVESGGQAKILRFFDGLWGAQG